ncbi:UDP-glucose glucosyltransferase [Pyrus ussuriensis x Pyrus communis]|uniref:UDP-glucose glucosyltransferase n=1 Tax=Pyrus ussuriensis x Pyrus communis TaxID=2448454 RepID=A0A5N5FX02_9ROSA|nr:UDP-glucose glucosyltransferase [Pyrus ussuriensis x Pyrus communis]
MGTEIIPTHMVLVCFPGQRHINPMLRLGKRLAAKGFLVSFSTTENFGKEMRATNSGISDEPTPVGDGFIRFEDLDYYMPQLELVGKDLVTQMIKRHANEGRPVSCLVNNPFIPWFLYINKPCKAVRFPTETEPNLDVQLPGMPLLKHDEIPSFLHPSDRFQVLGRAILGQFKKLSKSMYVLINTFQELEPEVIEHMSQFCMVKPVGPLFKNPKPPQTTISGDLMKADDCLEWLDSKPPISVVYISFGSLVYLKQEQVDEIAHGLWEYGFEEHVLPDKFLEKVGHKGKFVKWSPQEQVLAHPSIACFVTHCGWNSSVEALTWGDQVTNAKFLVDVSGVGLRLSRGAAENRLSMRDKVGKCLLEATVGQKAIELKRNALKWKLAAEAAVAEGGSSDHLQDFLDEIIKTCAA